jgi:ribosomal protein S27AE
MPNPRIRNWKPLSGLKKGEVLEFECGRCGRTGLVTLLQLIRRKISLDTPIEDLVRKSFCKRCGRPDLRNRVRIRNGRD